MREAMSALSREVIASHEARATGLASMRRDVSAQLRELDQVHSAMAQQQRDDLARVRTELRASVGAQLRELDQAHNAMAQQQRDDLAKGPPALRASVGAQLRELDQVHNAMAQQQRDDLAKGHAVLRAMAQQQRDDLAKGHAELRAGVSAQLRELDQAHNAMAQQQRDDLAKLTADRRAARQEWDHIAAALQRPRGGFVPKAPPAYPAGGGTDGSAALRDRVFAYLADHPDGVRFMEIEQQFRLDSQEASSVLRSLVEDGKAKRAGRLYLAT